MNLFLSSYFSDVAHLFAEYKKDCDGKTVTFIPTTSQVEEVTFYVDEGKEALKRMGMTIDELDISTTGFDKISSKLTTNDVIYVTGGNIFYLL